MPQPASSTKPRVEFYDTTLRDGTQGIAVSFSLVDKLNIARRLDEFGVDYIEGGYPLSNPKDVAFFEEASRIEFKYAKLCAFGMTRRRGIAAAEDPGMQALVRSGAPVITIVGKTWDLHVDEVLRVSREENLAMIRDSVEHCATAAGPSGSPAEVFYDAEHFFDGYRANPDYALATLRAALEGGATRLVLCDTNGGSLPQGIADAIEAVRTALGNDVKLGIHVHNDGGLAVANSLAGIDHGCVQVQGTINGIGERCGNVDLLTVAANLKLKLSYDCLRGDSLQQLTELSRYVYETANMALVANQPFVGEGAFAHKGGMHVHAVQRIAHSYEHVEPGSVGNERRVLVSELSGASNIAATLGRKFNIAEDKELQRKVLNRVQDLENEGYQFEAAAASFELLLHDVVGDRPRFFDLDHYRCVIYKRDDEQAVTEAIVKLRAGGQMAHHVAEGDGPVNALDGALRKCLEAIYPELRRVHLVDYKVRVVNAQAETAAKVRVMTTWRVAGEAGDRTKAKYFTTIGVNENVVDASWQAITDAFDYQLIEAQAKVSQAAH